MLRIVGHHNDRLLVDGVQFFQNFEHVFGALAIEVSYRFIGQEEKIFRAHPGAPAQPGSSCDFCFTGIMGVFWFKSKDGKKFKVGCDCLRKASKDADDYPLQTLAARLTRDHNRNVRRAREKAKMQELETLLDSSAEILATIPHPYKQHSDNGLTLMDYADWMRKHAGASGRVQLLKLCKTEIEKASKQKEVA